MIDVKINKEKCGGCGSCVNVCPIKKLFLKDGKVCSNPLLNCIGCRGCECVCPKDAIRVVKDEV